MRRNHAAFLHVGEHHFAVGDAGASCHLDVARRQLRVITGFGQRARLAQPDVEQFVRVEDDLVGVEHVAEFARMGAALRDSRHRDVGEDWLDELERIVPSSS